MQYLDQNEGEEGAGAQVTFCRKAGCEHCNGTGYHGRIGIFEVVFFNDELRDAIVRNTPVAELEAIARQKGCRSLAMDAIEKAKLGLVTIDDIYPILLEKGS
jgi:type II secretory ATPase GspE/PulE/Tfp pilus assembly ATPase PilB-like protein